MAWFNLSDMNKILNRVKSYVDAKVPAIYSKGVGIEIENNVLKTKLKTEESSSLSAASPTSTNDRQYPVQADKDGYLSVNVPWQSGGNYTQGAGIKIENDVISTVNQLVRITQEEFDALSEADKADTTKFYFITDSKDYSGGGGASNLVDLEDVSLSDLKNGQILSYNTNTKKWENKTLEIVTSLVNLTDVNVNSLSDKQIIYYDSSSSKFKNMDLIVANIKDTSISNLSSGQVLSFNGSNWVNKILTIINEFLKLEDVALTSLTDGQIFYYDAASQKIRNTNYTWDTLKSKPFSTLDSGDFSVSDNKLILNTKHIITNEEPSIIPSGTIVYVYED